MKKIIILILLVAFSISSCEKDDICDANTPTTPRLIIEFYNRSNPSEVKNVTDLKVIGIGNGITEGIAFNPNATDETKYLTNGTKIWIPLKTTENSTTYQFILNSQSLNPTLIDTDEITFHYTRNDVFVSRACGFKTLFTFDTTNPFDQTAVPATKPNWMQIFQIQKHTIDNENETHVKVYF